MKYFSIQKKIFVCLIVIAITLNFTENCGIEHAGPIKSELLSKSDNLISKKGERLNKFRNLSKTNSRRNLLLSITECPECLKVKFDFDVLDTHIDYVDFRTPTEIDSVTFKPQTDVLKRLKYLFDEKTGSPNVLQALNNLVKTDQSLTDLSKRDCYEKGYQLSQETLSDILDYDLFIIPVIDTVNLGCQTKKDKMWVKFCYQDKDTRKPIFALMGFSPYFETTVDFDTWKANIDKGYESNYFNRLFNRILHQMIHLMGFHLDLFSQLAQSNGSRYDMLREMDFRVDLIDPVIRKETSPRPSDYVYSHKALEHTKLSNVAVEYYNCNTNNIRLPLENSGGPGIAHMHFESSLFLNELMTALPESLENDDLDKISNDVFISPFTTTFLYSTGWYKSKYPDNSNQDLHGNKYTYGKGMGCDFLKGFFFSNDKPKFHHFCNKENTLGCTPNLSGIGKCNYVSDCSTGLCNENKCNMPSAMHYIFSDRRSAGDSCLNDNIPYYKPDFVSDITTICRNPEKSDTIKTFHGRIVDKENGQSGGVVNGQACFYHNIVKNMSNDNSSASTTKLDFNIVPSCFNYKCVSNVLNVCLTDTNCFPCVDMTKADGNKVTQAFVKIDAKISTEKFEGYIICPPPDQLCASSCETIYECIFANFIPVTVVAPTDNKVSLILEGGFNQCCACCESQNQSVKKAKHCLGANFASTTCNTSGNMGCCGDFKPGRLQNCSYHEYCLIDSYYTEYRLLCCGPGMTTNCSTFDNCVVQSDKYPCGNPFNLLHTSTYDNCSYQRPICNEDYKYTVDNSNCITTSSSIYGFTLPLMRKCTSSILTNCNEMSNVYIDNNTVLLNSYDSSAVGATGPFYDSTTDTFDLSTMTNFKLPKCFENRKKPLLESGQDLYVCILLKGTDVGKDNMYDPENGFEFHTLRATLCNLSTFSNCISSEYFKDNEANKFNLSTVYFLPCASASSVDCVAPNTDSSNINVYNIFQSEYCCPNLTSNTTYYNQKSFLYCKICTAPNAATPVKGITMPFFRKCPASGGSFCLKVPDDLPAANQIYEVGTKAPHEMFSKCYKYNTTDSSCLSKPADVKVDVLSDYYIYCDKTGGGSRLLEDSEILETENNENYDNYENHYNHESKENYTGYQEKYKRRNLANVVCEEGSSADCLCKRGTDDCTMSENNCTCTTELPPEGGARILTECTPTEGDTSCVCKTTCSEGDNSCTPTTCTKYPQDCECKKYVEPSCNPNDKTKTCVCKSTCPIGILCTPTKCNPSNAICICKKSTGFKLCDPVSEADCFCKTLAGNLCDPNNLNCSCVEPCKTATNPFCVEKTYGGPPAITCASNYKPADKCCNNLGLSDDAAEGCKLINCVIEVKKCKLTPPTAGETNFCQYDPEADDTKCNTKQTTGLLTYGTDTNDLFYEICDDSRNLKKFCCPDFKDENVNFYSNPTKCESPASAYCIKYVLPCCNTLSLLGNINTTDCISGSDHICFNFGVQMTTKFIPLCPDSNYSSKPEMNIFCLRISSSTNHKPVSLPSIELQTGSKSNKNSEAFNKKLICCDAIRTTNCFRPLDAHKSSYCKMLPTEYVPTCTQRSRDFGLNLNCNNKVAPISTTPFTGKFPCCFPDYSNLTSCATYPNCVILPCCDTLDGTLYTKYKKSDGTLSTNCIKPNNTPPIYPTNCHIEKPCCTTKISANDYTKCSTSKICFPQLEECTSAYNPSAVRNCVRFSSAKPASQFVQASSNWCELNPASCSAVNLPERHSCQIVDAAYTFDNFLTNQISNKYLTTTTLSSRFCFETKFYTFVPPNCPKVYDIANPIKNCIFNYDAEFNYKNQFCCEPNMSINGNCYKAPLSTVITAVNDYCIPTPAKKNCCLPISPSDQIQTDCSFVSGCVSNFFQPCCNEILLDNCNKNNSGGCIKHSTRCTNKYNILGKCHNLKNSYLPTACSTDNNTNCVPPLRCCDTYTNINCSNLPNCLKPLPTCDINRGKGSSEFSISDEIPCIGIENGVKKPFGLSGNHPYLSDFNKIGSNYITTPAEFDLVPCCSPSKIILGCVNDNNYCIPEMKCCYKTKVDEYFFETRSYVFTKNCSNLANCHEAGPCKCSSSDPLSENCKSVFNVPDLNDTTQFCYAPLPYCESVDTNLLFKYNCCDSVNNRTNCVLHGSCNNIEISNYDSIPFCSPTLSPRVKNYCIQQFDISYLINFDCCSETVLNNCIIHPSCNVDTSSLNICAASSPVAPCYYGNADKAKSVCCKDNLNTNITDKDCVLDPAGACSSLDLKAIEPCTDSLVTNCYKGNFVVSFVRCNSIVSTNCIKIIETNLSVALFKSLDVCASASSTNCFVKSTLIQKDDMVSKTCCTATNSINCIKTDFCSFPDMTKSDVITRNCIDSNDDNCLVGKFVVGNYNCCSSRYTYDCIYVPGCENGIDLLTYKSLSRCSSGSTSNCFIVSANKSKYDVVTANCCNSRYTTNCIRHEFCRNSSIILSTIELCSVSIKTNCYKGNVTKYSCVTTSVVDAAVAAADPVAVANNTVNPYPRNAVVNDTCGSLSWQSIKTLSQTPCGGSTRKDCYYGPYSLKEIVNFRCCNTDVDDDCLIHASCPKLIKTLKVCVKGELDFNCLYMNCDPEKDRGIKDNTYHCCAGSTDLNCNTLENCVQAAPCKINGIYEIYDSTNRHPVNDFSTFSGNCFQPRPCCITKDPPDPADCNVNEIDNKEAILKNSILLEALVNYNSIIHENISANNYIQNGVVKNIFDVGKSIKQLKEENLIHKCIATDFKKQYSCCNEDDPAISTNCHKLTNCIKPKKCHVDILGNAFIFPNNPDLIDIKNEDPRNCYKPRSCCSVDFNDKDLCEDDPLKCIPVAYPCCGTGPDGNVVETNCHSLPNCIFPKPCCSPGNYSLKRSNNTPATYPPECNNLPNCYPAKPCCNINTTNRADENKEIIKEFDLKCPFGSPITQYVDLCKGDAWKGEKFPTDCRWDYGENTDLKFKDEIFKIKKINTLDTRCLAYSDCFEYVNSTCRCIGPKCNKTSDRKMCLNCCKRVNDKLLQPITDTGETPKCIKTLRCCAGAVSSNCHNLKNCHGYFNNDTKKVENIKCWTDHGKDEEKPRKYQRVKYEEHPFCEQGIPCCKNPPEKLRELDPKIYQCDNTMDLIPASGEPKVYDPNSLSNCKKTKICCSPDYKDINTDPTKNKDCSWDFNCFPIAYPKNEDGKPLFFKITPDYYTQANLLNVSPQFYLESPAKVNAYVPQPCCEPGKDSTILKPCSISSRFCIPPMPCCSNVKFTSDGKTSNNSPYGCVEASVFFNCRDVAPKCEASFKTKECSDLYNTWPAKPCSDAISKANNDPTYKTSVWPTTLTSSSDPADYCIRQLPCCTPRYTTNCHNLLNADGTPFCFKEDYKCIKDVYHEDYLKSSATQAYTCSEYPNAIEPVPCCTPELQSNCIPVSNYNFDLTKKDYGCIPPMPCCDIKAGKDGNLQPCHNLKNCQPPKPCCLFDDNKPAVLRDGKPTKRCTGCRLGKFTIQNDECCIQAAESTGCTRNREKTLNYLLCPDTFPNLSIRPKKPAGEIDSDCITQLPCCSKNGNGEFIENSPELCKTTDDCNDNFRPCCKVADVDYPVGCKNTDCKVYEPYCEYSDSPIIKSNTCSIVDNCIALPKPCCKKNKFPAGCAPESENKFIGSSSFPNKPCCLNNNVSNGPDDCVIKGSGIACLDIFPCCENDKLDKPKACKIYKLENGVANCLRFQPKCTTREDPLYCEEDKFKCLPILPCCTPGTTEENCVSANLKSDAAEDKRLIPVDDDIYDTYPNYPYCMLEGPKCSLIYQMADCSSFPNAYETIPCCPEGEDPTYTCNDSDKCIDEAPCCADNQSDRSACHNLANCIPPLPKCVADKYMLNGCSNYSNAWDPVPCCDKELPYDSKKGDSHCKREVNGVKCIKRELYCCYLDEDGQQVTKNGIIPTENCHNLANCIPGKPICDCIGAKYIRNDCTLLTNYPNFLPKPCCGETTNTGDMLNLSDGLCAEPPECVSNKVLKPDGNPFLCCPTENKFTYEVEQCTNENISEAKKSNCDNLLNCLKPGPLCVPGRYMIKTNYPTLWEGKVKPCINDENAGYTPYLCDKELNKIESEKDTEFNIRCLPKLPCCLDPSNPPSKYPCHNLIGCIPQNGWCCTAEFNLFCVNKDLDDSGNVLPGVTKPKIIHCKEPIPCCDGNIDRTKCVMPNTSIINSSSNERILPTNCILPELCCKNFQNQSLQNDIICHDLPNCIKNVDEYYLDTILIKIPELSINSTFSKGEGIDQRNIFNLYQTQPPESDERPSYTSTPQSTLEDVIRQKILALISFPNSYSDSESLNNEKLINNIRDILNENNLRQNANAANSSEENRSIYGYLNSNLVGDFNSGSIPNQLDPTNIDVNGNTSQPSISQSSDNPAKTRENTQTSKSKVKHN